jgi:hypothetical protein
VTAIAKDYATQKDGVEGIRQHLVQFYNTKYPHVVQYRPAVISAAVVAVQSIFTHSRFPEMKTDWRSHPNNIGHLVSSGCFRCHDGYHVDDKGKAISSDCSTCHTFLYRRGDGSTIEESKFRHEMKINNLWEGFGPHANLQCQICHTGALTANEPGLTSSACGDCHPSGRWIEMRRKGHFRETPLEAATQPDS